MTSSDQATKINAGSEPPRSRNFSEFGTPLTYRYTIVCIWIAKLLSALLFYHYLLGSVQLCCAWLLWLQHWFMAINLHPDASSDSGHGRTEESAFSWNYFSWRRFNRDSNSAVIRCFHFWSFRISPFLFFPPEINRVLTIKLIPQISLFCKEKNLLSLVSDKSINRKKNKRISCFFNLRCDDNQWDFFLNHWTPVI